MTYANSQHLTLAGHRGHGADGRQPPRFAANKDMVQLQTQVQSLQDQVARLQQSVDMNMGVMKNLIEQSADSVNKMNATVNDLQNKMQGLTADNNGKIDQLSTQVQSLHDSVDELKSRLAKVSKQLDDMQQGGQNLPAGQPGMTPAPSGARQRDAARWRCLRCASAGCSLQQRAARLQLRQVRSFVAGVRRLHQVLLEHRSGGQRAVLHCRHRISPGQL